MNSWVGQTLGKVRIDTLLARGGTAEVYIGTHTTLQREVAIKVLHNNYDDHPHALERFQREAMVVGKLRHPNIVQVFDFDTTADSHPYLVMEYIKGPSLLKYLNSIHSKGVRLEFPHVVRLMDAMTSALQYAHDSGVIHRDIKPGNILLTSRSSDIVLGKPLPDDFEPVLTDFGLVRFIDSTQHTTGSGQIAGTPAYMSPEQARGELTDGRTDIYSLGIVLYEILAGHLPFEGETTMGVLMKHISEPPAPIPGLPPTMQYVLDRALAKNVEDRFQTPAEFAEAFTAAVSNKGDYSTLDVLSASGTTTKRPAKRIFGQTKKQRNWVAPVLAALVAVGLGATFFLRGLPSASPPASSASATGTATLPAPSLTSTIARTSPPVILLGRTGVLQFKNAAALVDEASLIAEALLAPPPDSHYEVWLSDGKQRLSLGILTLDENGRGELIFKQPDGTNLISLYDTVEVTIEPDPDSSAASSGIVAYSFTLPAEGLVHVRYLLSSYPTTPNNNALIQGLFTDIEKMNDLASAMQKAADSGDQAHVRSNAEGINNIIVGSKSSAHKDWDNNGEVYDPSDGFGLLLNGQNAGYLEAAFAEAGAVLTSPNASEQMVQYGRGVEASVNNLAQWITELQTLITAIQTSTDSANTKLQVSNALALTNKMLNGIDVDSNGSIDPVAGEGGAQTAYDQAYHMADMPLRPVGIFNLGTGTPTFVAVSATSSGSGGGGGGGSVNATATPKPKVTPPGQVKTQRPPKTPKGNTNTSTNTTTTNNSNNGGGNGSNP
jgi:tRNA A-37 threonylcarbamoyl transferase component Bud32